MSIQLVCTADTATLLRKGKELDRAPFEALRGFYAIEAGDDALGPLPSECVVLEFSDRYWVIASATDGYSALFRLWGKQAARAGVAFQPNVGILPRAWCKKIFGVLAYHQARTQVVLGPVTPRLARTQPLDFGENGQSP